jgi:hypothetical protein
MIGTLADGTALSQSTAVSEDGSWALFVSLYGGRGFLMGRMSLDTNSWVAPVAWLMPPSLPRCFYTEGLYQWRNAVLAPYFVPPARQNAVNWTNGAVAIRGGDLPTPLETQVVLSNNVCRVVGGSISNLNLTITVNNGLFVGSFVHPVSKRLTGFRGALDQNPPDFPYPLNSGGWFLGPNGQAGVVRLHPQ